MAKAKNEKNIARTGYKSEKTQGCQRRFVKGRCCLTNLISFYDRVTQWVRERLWMLFTRTLAKPFTPFPTAFSWRNWLLVAWMDVLLAG